MSLKLIALLTIMLCGLLAGLECKRKLSIRVQSLAMFRLLFLDMKSMISHSSLTLEDMIWDMAGRQTDNRFATQMSEYISHYSFREAWKMSLDELNSVLCLTEGDIKLLQGCADMLGKSDVDGELASLALIDERLSLAVEEARGKLNSDGKIYTAVGSSCGIILALLLI